MSEGERQCEVVNNDDDGDDEVDGSGLVLIFCWHKVSPSYERNLISFLRKRVKVT